MNLVVTRLVPMKESALQPVRFSRARGPVNPYCAVVAENTQRVRPPHPPKEIRIAAAHIGRTPITPENIDTRRRHSPADSFRLQYASHRYCAPFCVQLSKKICDPAREYSGISSNRNSSCPLPLLCNAAIQVRFTVF